MFGNNQSGHSSNRHLDYGQPTSDIDDDNPTLPVIQVFGTDHCFFATRSQQLLNQELVRPEPYIDNTSTYTTVSPPEKLMDMSPKYRYSPRVYVDNRFIGGYSELWNFIESLRTTSHHEIIPQFPTGSDAVIRKFVYTHNTEDRKLFLAITAGWCSPCNHLKSKLGWNDSKTPGHQTYRSNTSTALCFTLGPDESMVSDILQNSGIQIIGYPTILTYSKTDHTWKTVDQTVLTGIW
jgi:hypothetical protein